MNLNTIQNFIWPNTDIGADEKLYFRVGNSATLQKDSLIFSAHGKVSLDTFFNTLSVSVWKKHTQISTLYLKLLGIGSFIIRLGLHRTGHHERWLMEQTLDLQKEEIIELPFWSQLEEGLLFCEFEALDKGKITGGGFFTTDKPVNHVHLGIVITHFNRKQYVLPAIKRINQNLLNNPLYSSQVKLIVIDNSQNITVDEADGATVIPNLNLGGSGGFTRGLLHLKDQGDFTHCLFMDDDASCEIESISRTVHLLQYNITPKFAVAGSLLREVESYRLFEKGAKFKGVCLPLKSNLDMRKITDLLLAEHEDQRPDYGGWWFFAFRIEDIKSLAFPFFVRGDDIMFSLLNQPNICTTLGVACWGEDFAYKSGVLPIYLDVRNHLLQQILFLNGTPFKAFTLSLKFFLAALLSYNYASAQAIGLAVKHFTDGPDFWRSNMDMSKVRPEILQLEPNEKLHKVNLVDYDFDYPDYNEWKPRKIFRILTLNGFLIPSVFLKKGTMLQEKAFRGWLRCIFGYKNVLYYYTPLGMGYVAQHDKTRALKETINFLRYSISLANKYKSLKRDYQNALPELTSESFWRKVYNSMNITSK